MKTIEGTYVSIYNWIGQANPLALFFLNILHFEIKPRVVQLLRKFHEMDKENPYLYIREFEKVCTTINM